MFRYFLSENIKVKHTFAKKLVWISPIFVISFAFFLAPGYSQVDCYNWWYTLILPGVLTLRCVLLSKIDGVMKNKAVISLPIDLKKIWIGKILVEIKNLFISCMIIFSMAQLSIFVLKMEDGYEINILNGLAAIVVIIIVIMWQVPLWMSLGSKLGVSITMILSLAANILLGTMAVKEYWWMSPFSYIDRLMCPILKILPNGLQAKTGNQTFTPELLNTSVIPIGIIVSILLFFIITYLTAKWYEGQEAI